MYLYSNIYVQHSKFHMFPSDLCFATGRDFTQEVQGCRVPASESSNVLKETLGKPMGKPSQIGKNLGKPIGKPSQIGKNLGKPIGKPFQIGKRPRKTHGKTISNRENHRKTI